MTSETSLSWILAGGAIVSMIGLLWLIVAAFRVKWSWGLFVLFILPVGLPFFVVRHFKAAAWPFAIFAIGLSIGSAPIAYARFLPVDLGPYEKVVGGEVHLTLTKWDRKDYSILARKLDTVVLQMANPDVNDATLVYLKGMTRLRELDLSETGVDDAGLKELGSLTGLETLRLKDTKITDQGFRTWLLPRESLMELDLRKTGVTKETGRAWKEARPKRRLLQ